MIQKRGNPDDVKNAKKCPTITRRCVLPTCAVSINVAKMYLQFRNVYNTAPACFQNDFVLLA